MRQKKNSARSVENDSAAKQPRTVTHICTEARWYHSFPLFISIITCIIFLKGQRATRAAKVLTLVPLRMRIVQCTATGGRLFLICYILPLLTSSTTRGSVPVMASGNSTGTGGLSKPECSRRQAGIKVLYCR